MPEYFVVRTEIVDGEEETQVRDLVIYTDTKLLAAALTKISKHPTEDWALFERVGDKMVRRAVIVFNGDCTVQ